MHASRLPYVRELLASAAEAGVNARRYTQNGSRPPACKNMLQSRHVLVMFTMPRCAFAVAVRAMAHDRRSRMSEKLPIIVVLGIDVDGRAHGSRFEERDAPFVQRAAEMMRFHVVRVPPENDELHAVAEKLPLGKI